MNKPKLNSTIQIILVTVFSFLFVTMISYATTIGANISTGGTLAVTGTSTFTGLTTLANASTTQLSVSNNLYTALTANSIPYITTSGLLTEDNSNLVWDSTNNRMGIGTSSPYAALSVVGETVASNFTATSTTATTTLAGGLSVGSGGLVYDHSSNDFWVDTNTLYVDSSASKVGIGISSPVYTLDVNGAAKFRGNNNAITIASGGGTTYGYITIVDNDFQFMSSGHDARLANDSGGGVIVKDTSGYVGIGTTTPTASLQVTTTTSDATTTVEFGKANQTKGTCLKLYDATGAAVYCSVTGSGLSCSTTVNCAN